MAMRGTAPNPVTNRDLAKVIGKLLHRPTFMTAPALALKLALGEAAAMLLTGQRVRPGRLEGAQAGLSWLTILRKRAAYRRVFAGFDPAKLAKFTKANVRRLMEDDGIVRNHAKIEAAITNAHAFLLIERECGSFASYVWQFVGRKPIQNTWRRLEEIPAETEES